MGLTMENGIEHVLVKYPRGDRGFLIPVLQEVQEFYGYISPEVVDEIGLLIENLDCRSQLASDQMSNLLVEVEGRLPDDKPDMLGIIARYKAMPIMERLKLRLERRARSYLAVYGAMEPALSQKVEEALAALKSESPEAMAKVEIAIAALKQGFV